ncbi:MAG: LysM peptidoglycan-binding domain-containing protein [Smithella sp.]|nr:LysM peptidoglycan-binding domain-containing protein [Smithella sp.]
MIRCKSNFIASVILVTFVFAIPLFGCAQNVAERKRNISYVAQVSNPSVKNEPRIVTEVGAETDAMDIETDDDFLLDTQTREEKQEIMEKALELMEQADKLWEKGNVDETLSLLDDAYALILDSNEDSIVAQEKDDLRFLISRRILAVYSSKQAVVNGKSSEIPMVMNDYVQKEIRSFQGVERNSFIAAYQRSGMYHDIIMREIKKAGIPEEFFWLPLVESLFKVNAYSRARALGLWQFIPSTGYKFGLNRDEWIDERMDVLKSTHAAIAYLKELHKMFGDWLTVLAAYNCGEGRVLRVISRQHINYFDSFWDLYRQLPNETARYVPRFLATLHIVNNPKKYGFDLSYTEQPIAFSTVKVNKIMSLKDIAERIDVSEEALSLLNPELRNKMTPDREYFLKVPEESCDKFNLVYDDIPQSERPRVEVVRSTIVTHRVRDGETLYSIARKYKVTASAIVSHNKLKSKNRIYRGQVLRIPTTQKAQYASSRPSAQQNDRKQVSSSGRYKVQKGDTLLKISRNYSVSLSQLKALNNLKTEKIHVGQTLKIPQKDTYASSGSSRKKSSSPAAPKSKIDKQMLSTSDIDQLGTDKYIVTKNDTLHIIARKNNTNVDKLLKLNSITIEEKILPGQILIVR